MQRKPQPKKAKARGRQVARKGKSTPRKRSASAASAASRADSVRSGLSVRMVTPGQLMGASGSATVAPFRRGGAEVVALHAQLRGTLQAWEISLLETLINPMSSYPLPGITATGHWGYNPATYPNGDSDPFDQPSFYPQFFGDCVLPDQSALTQDVPATNVPAMQMDTYAGSRYDQREGLVRGTFSVEQSGTYLIWFDPADIADPVIVRSLKNTEEFWTHTDNTTPIFAGGQDTLPFQWDRDPYRNYSNNFRALSNYGNVSTNQFTYIGGAVLHLAVQAKTAYSDVAIKARNISCYDRRFFDAPTKTGEYGDPSQPEKANEAAALYNGSVWQPVFAVTQDDKNALANRMWYIIQRGLPMLEVHVVNATTGGAPVNFNFEARTWLGVTYTSLKDAATTSYHTVPAEIPPWFSACKTRGAVTMKRSELGEALITNTVNSMVRTPAPPLVRAVVDKIAPARAGPNFFQKMLGGIADVIGVDKSNPIPSIASLVTGKILPAIAGLF